MFGLVELLLACIGNLRKGVYVWVLVAVSWVVCVCVCGFVL